MEIKTTENIWKDFCKQLDLEVLEVGATTKVEGWCRVYQEENKDKKWVAVDDLIKCIENFDDETAFNEWQIRKTTLIKHITKNQVKDSKVNNEQNSE